MKTNYEESTMNSVNMASSHLDFGFELVRADLLQLSLNSSLCNYAAGVYHTDPQKENEVFLKTREDLINKTGSNKFIQSIYVVTNDRIKSIYSDENKSVGVLTEWINSQEIKSIPDKGIATFGSHQELDKLMGVDSNQYALSFVGKLNNKSAYVVINIHPSEIEESLTSLALGEGSMKAFVTSDNKQIIISEQKDGKSNSIIFANQKFYQESLASESHNGMDYVTYNGDNYLYLYSKSDSSQSMICVLVPSALIIKEANSIKLVTILSIIIGCILLSIIAFLTCISIGVGINKITKRLHLFAKGDLTVTIPSVSYKEFSILSQNIMTMVMNTKQLIEKVKMIVDKVSQSSNQVSGVSVSIQRYTENISSAIAEIDLGVVSQAEDIQSCLKQMDRLSEMIVNISEVVCNGVNSADTTKKMIEKGIKTVQVLTSQSNLATEVTRKVIKNVKELEVQSQRIADFVKVIDDIAEQTNLLSLNATIEAARVGNVGSGFAVVAEEIRKLADGSKVAATEIEGIISQIQSMTAHTSENAVITGDIVEHQAQIVSDTIQVFDQINVSTDDLIHNLQIIDHNISDLNEDRAATLEGLENISAFSEETVASVTVVNQTITEQLEIAKELELQSKGLEERMSELDDAIQVFKLT
jgi:methyl-accepting chemotaxis protein